MKRKIAIAVIVFAVLLLAAGLVVRQSARLTPWTAEAKKPERASGAEIIALPQDGDYTMLAAENETYMLLAREDGKIAVINKITGAKFESNPLEADPKAIGINKTNMNSQLYITFASEGGITTTKNSTTDCVNKGWLTWEGVENGIRYLYDFEKAGIKIPVEYILEQDGLRASILVDDIEEGSAGLFLTDVAFLPYFGAADGESAGYTLVPDGCGALIHHNNQKASYGAYKQAVYGRDAALVIDTLIAQEQTVRLPVFGLKQGDNGFFAIIEQGDAVATVNALTGGTITSYNNVYASFRYRPYSMGTFYQGNAYAHDGVGDTQQTLMLPNVRPSNLDFTVKYILLEREGLSYVDMARVYREYLIAHEGLKKRVEDDSAPFYLQLLGGIVKDDVLLGVRLPVLQVLTPFDDAVLMLNALREGGINDIALKYTGWQRGGIESKILSNVAIESKLGGKDGYAALAKYAEANGVKLFMDFDFVNLYKSGNGVSTFTDAVQTVGKTPTYIYTYNYNTLEKQDENRWRLLTPRMAVAALSEAMKELDALRGANISLSTLGTTVYSDFTNKSNGIDRANARALWGMALDMADDASEYLMVDGGNAYSLPYVSHIYNVPYDCTMFDIEDDAIPFYQIALHGYISYSSEPMNLSSNPKRLTLKALETGSSLSACLMSADNHALAETNYVSVMSGNYETWVSALCDAYASVKTILSEVAAHAICGHERLSEDMYKTTYENGAIVYVNYGAKAALADGIWVGAMDYAYISGKEAQ